MTTSLSGLSRSTSLGFVNPNFATTDRRHGRVILLFLVLMLFLLLLFLFAMFVLKMLEILLRLLVFIHFNLKANAVFGGNG